MNSNSHYHVYTNLPFGPYGPYPELAQTSLRPLPYFLKAVFNITFLYTPRSSKFSLSVKNLHQILVCYTSFKIRAMCSVLLTLLDHPHMIGEEQRSLISSLCTLLQSPVTSSILHTNIFPINLSSNTPILCFSLNVREKVSGPYKTTNKIA